MKKLIASLIILVFLGFPCFGSDDEKEEIDYLLFMPNSGNQFVNSAQAAVQLDKLANYLRARNLAPGQVCVYGYAADRANDIDPVKLSGERALFVINELQKRGIGRELFSAPIAYGSVDLWGANTNEEDRIPNRRVRILLDGTILTPETVKTAEAAPIMPVLAAPVTVTTVPAEKSGFKFPWWLLILLLIAIVALLIFLALRSRKHTEHITVEESPPSPVAPAPKPVEVKAPEKSPEPEKGTVIVPVPIPVKTSVKVVDLEEEIRYCAYMLGQERNGLNGDMDGDWYKAVQEIGGKYEASGHEVYTEDGFWWARKTISQ